MRSTIAAMLMLLATHSVAVAAAPNPGRAADLRKQAEGVLKQAEGFVALAGKSEGELAASATDAATACREAAAALETLATAVAIGVSQEQAIDTATAALGQLQKRQTAALERLNVRQAVAGLHPAAAVLETLMKATPEANKPLLDALLAARQKALAAGAAVHDAIAPEADPLVIEVRRDDWIRAQNDLTLATRALNAANERARLATLPGADRPAAAAKLAEIAARDGEVLAAHAAVLAATLEARLADRSRAAAGKAYGDATWATLTSLTLEQAKAYADLESVPVAYDHDDWWNMFDALTSLSPEAAEVLVKPERPLSPSVFKEFSKGDASWKILRKVRRLSLNGLTELSPELAAALALHPPVPSFGYADLRLNGLKTLSPQAAEALSHHEGKVQLYAVEELDSVPLAQKLARQWGELRLGVNHLSPEIAAELAKHRGYEKPYHRLNYFGRLDGAISVLRLDNIESLSAETAEALAAHEGVLVLNGLVSLDPPVAAALAKRTGNSKTNAPGTLVLNGLPAISTEAAAALAAFPGEIVLKGITEMSPETAAALAKHKGRLYLTGLVKISPETDAALQAHPEVLLPRPLPLQTELERR
jgi:hypothetical protein